MNSNNPKFRVWSRPDNKFLPINSDEYELSFHGDIWLVKKLCQTFAEQLRNTHVVDGVDYVMQEGLGLPDKHGTDIFEGDIIAVAYELSFQGQIKEIIEVCRRDNISRAFYDEPYGRHIDSSRNPAKIGEKPWFYMKEFRVIGNIFQNPEIRRKK